MQTKTCSARDFVAVQPSKLAALFADVLLPVQRKVWMESQPNKGALYWKSLFSFPTGEKAALV